MDMQRMQFFLGRLQEQAQKALASGDPNAAKAYTDLIRQAEKAVQGVASGPSPVQAGAPSQSPMMPQASPMGGDQIPMPLQQTPPPAPTPAGPFYPNGSPEDFPMPSTSRKNPMDMVAEEEAMRAWHNAPQDPNSLAANAWAAVAQRNVPTAKPQSMADWLFTPVQGDKPVYPSDVLNAAGEIRPSDVATVGKGAADMIWQGMKGGPGSILAVNPAFAPFFFTKGTENIPANIGANAPIKDWLKERTMRERGPSELEHTLANDEVAPNSGDVFSPSESGPEGNAVNPSLSVSTGHATVVPPGISQASIPTPNSGEKPAGKGNSGWGLADLFGLLFGGRNFLNYKAQAEQAQLQRDWQTGRDEASRTEREQEHKDYREVQNQKLAVEYMKALQQKAKDEREYDTPEAKDYRAAVSASAQLGNNPNDPFTKEVQASAREYMQLQAAKRRAQALQLKANQE